MSADAGSTYCMRVRATNIAGDVGAWSEARCAAVPLDDRDLARRGAWREASGAENYSGTALVARARGAKLIRTVTGKQVSLLVTKRSDGGRVLIYRGDRLVKRMSLKASSTRHMQVLISSTKRVVTARYRIVVVSQGRPVTIDGMVVSRG